MYLRSIGGFAALLSLSARAATITVTTEADSLDDVGAFSLRDAVRAANTDLPAGGCPAGSGADAIVLGEGVYDLKRPGASEDLAVTGDLDILNDLLVVGAGPTSPS